MSLSLCLCVAGCNNNQPSSSSPSSSGEVTDLKTNIKEIKGIDLTNKENNIIKWEGRYEYKQKSSTHPDMMLLYHTATGFTVDFYGTELSAEFFHAKDLSGTLGGDIYYDVKVDDETLPNKLNRRIKLPSAEVKAKIRLVGGLVEGFHTVTIAKMNEASDCYTAVSAISTDGVFYRRDTNKDNEKLKFMAVCASGGSGYGSLAYSEKSGSEFSRNRANSSSLHAFNYLTARRFDADISFVAASGWGVKFPNGKSILDVIDKTGITPTNNVTGALTTGDWNKDLYVPDVIIFNIGGNDTPNSAFDLETYEQGVIDLVNKLHTYYPNAKMIWTHTSSKAGQYAINALKGAGVISEGYLKQCIISKVGEGDLGSGTYGAGNHNSLKTHIDCANSITSTLSRWGYSPVRDEINFSDFEYLLER